MKDAVIFKTGAVLENPAIGLDKMIINFPGGLVSEITSGSASQGLFLKRESASILYKIKIYNGHLMSKGNAYEWIDTGWLVSTTTDSFGNTIRYYEINDQYDTTYPIAEYCFHFTAGTTRVEVLDIHNYSTCWYGGIGRSYLMTEGEINIEGFALSDFPKVEVKNVPAYGDLSCLKNRDNITKVFVNSTNITGDIANLAKSAAKPGSFDGQNLQFAYCTGVYGELTTLLEAMKNRSDILGTGKTFTWYFYNTQVTYKGNLINQGNGRSVVFAADGTYTVDGV